MAIFGILPQAVVADIAEADELDTKENRSGMFYAARTFSMKMGQAIAMLLVTSLGTIGRAAIEPGMEDNATALAEAAKNGTGLGYRLIAVVAAAACIVGGLLFTKYDEKKIYSKILKRPSEKA